MEKPAENKELEKAGKKARPEWFVIVPVLLVSLAAFALWGFKGRVVSVQGVVTAALALLLFALGVIIAVPNAVRFFKGETEEHGAVPGERTAKRGRLHPIFGIIVMAIAARLIVFVTAYVILLISDGYKGTIFSTAESIWLRAGNHDLIGYGLFNAEFVQNTLTLPLYPLIIKALDLATHSSFASGVIVNTLASAGCAPLLYELALSDMGKRSARMAVFFSAVMPAAVFLAVPDCYALFMLLSAASLLAMRKGRFLPAGIFGMLASFTHIWGILLIVPYAAEAAAYAARRFKASGREGLWKVIVRVVCFGLLIPFGFFGYMLFTRIVLGSWFAFFEGNKGYLAVLNSPLTYAAGLTEELFGGFHNNGYLLGSVIPRLLHLFGALVLFMTSARTLRTSYTLWLAACFAVCGFVGFGSLPMLFTVTLAVPIALAHLCDSKDEGAGAVRAQAKASAAGAVLLTAQLLYLIMFVIGYEV